MSIDPTLHSHGLPPLGAQSRSPVPGSGADLIPGQHEPSSSGDGGGFSFWDFLDIINPLQHIPIVSTIYREVTGDQMGAVARIIGGGLFGGPIGLAAAVVNTVVEGATGKTLDGHAMAMLGFGDDSPDSGTMVADNAYDEQMRREADLALMMGQGALGGGTTAPAPTAAQALWQVEAASQQGQSFATAATRPLGVMPSPIASGLPQRSASELEGGEPQTWFTIDRSRPPAVTNTRLPAGYSGGDAVARQAAPAPSGGLPLGLTRPTATPSTATPTSAAAAPPPEAVHSALAAQGLSEQTLQAGADGAVDLPSWVDAAMMRAVERYQRTGQLSQ